MLKSRILPYLSNRFSMLFKDLQISVIYSSFLSIQKFQSVMLSLFELRSFSKLVKLTVTQSSSVTSTYSFRRSLITYSSLKPLSAFVYVSIAFCGLPSWIAFWAISRSIAPMLLPNFICNSSIYKYIWFIATKLMILFNTTK